MLHLENVRHVQTTEVYLELCETSMMKFFTLFFQKS